MSADNWADCPRCKVIRETALVERERAVEDAYGKVPVAEFDAMRADLERDKSTLADPTFREDYEIYGAEDGVVRVKYSGHCRDCNLRLKFEHEHPLDVGGAS